MQVHFPNGLRKTLVALFGMCFSAIVLSSLVVYVAAQGTPPADCPPVNSVPCQRPDINSDSDGATWPKGAKIIVNIDPSFSPEKIAAIKNSYNNWQAAGSVAGNGSRVTFTFTTNATPSTVPCLLVLIEHK
jgi:hypothetical protein